MPNQIKIRPLKDKLRQFFSPIVYECSIFRNNGKPIGGFADENEISDAFSPTHNYVVGEPCIYENVVRICTTPHNGDWDASHFRSTSVMGYAKEIVKNLGMPPEYDPDYEYLVGDLCTHNGLWYRSLWGYSGGGAGAWDETKWERVNSLDEIDALNQKIANNTKLHITDGRFFICKPSGVSLAYIVIPVEHIPSAVSATGFRIFHNSAWKDITLTESGFSQGELLLGFTMPSGVTLTDGLNYWARGSISCTYSD